MRQELPTTLTFWDGIILSVNAVSDVYLIINSEACGQDRPGKTGVMHDLMSRLMNWSGRPRVHYSQLETNDFVMGTDHKLRNKVREIAALDSASIILITQSSAAFLMSEDTETIADEMENETGIKIATIPSNVLVGDYVTGYGAALDALSRRTPLTSASKQPATVAIVGHLMDRLEEDNQANLRELHRMCGEIGVKVCSIWLNGTTFADLSSISQASRILSFPYGRRAAATLGERLGCPVTDMDMPIGLDGSAKWVRTIGRLFGRENEAEAFISRELDFIAPRLEWVVRDAFMNRNAALAADPHIAPGLVSYLSELGMRVRAVALRTRAQAAPAAIQDTLNHITQSAPIITDPTLPGLDSLWRKLHNEEQLDFIMASGSERNSAKGLNIPYFEFGFPSYARHALTDAPWMGFRGALWLADAMFNLLREWDYRKY